MFRAGMCRGTQRITQFIMILVKEIRKVTRVLWCRKPGMTGSVQPAG
jgi:hypothetical protein